MSGSAEETDDAEADDADDEFDIELLAELSGKITAMKRAIVQEDEDADLLEVAQDLWEVLDEIEDVLETVDFEELPDAIDLEELPEAVDVEDVPEGLLDEDETAIELTDVREAVNLRELWDAVDLTELYQEKQDLEDEMGELGDHFDGDGDGEDEDGLLGDDGLVGGDDEDDDLLDVDNVIGTEGAHVQFDAEARQAFLEEKIQDAVEKFRSALLSTHEMLRKLYRANQEKLGQPGRQPDSLNPTAASTMPPGPIPDSASLRSSTVPEEVKYSKVDNPRRIYGRRFTKATKGGDDARTAAAGSGGDAGESAESGEPDAEASERDGGTNEAEEADEESTESSEESTEPTIEVNDQNE